MTDPDRALDILGQFAPLVLPPLLVFFLATCVVVVAFRSRRLAWTRHGRLYRALLSVCAIILSFLFVYFWVMSWHFWFINHPRGVMAAFDEVVFFGIDDLYGGFMSLPVAVQSVIFMIVGIVGGYGTFRPFVNIALRRAPPQEADE